MRAAVRADQWLEKTHMTKNSARENGNALYGCFLKDFERYLW
jgi:hypothetical protein